MGGIVLRFQFGILGILLGLRVMEYMYISGGISLTKVSCVVCMHVYVDQYNNMTVGGHCHECYGGVYSARTPH